jgi:uncharacterized protein (DUF736 family)
MIIGTFTYENDTYRGELRSLTLQRRLVPRPTERPKDREPAYRIFPEGKGGTVEFGAAWKRTSETGQDSLSVVIDDPAMPAPLNAALFMRKGENTANLVWTRPPAKPKAEPKPDNVAPLHSTRPPRLRSPRQFALLIHEMTERP